MKFSPKFFTGLTEKLTDKLTDKQVDKTNCLNPLHMRVCGGIETKNY